MTEDFDFFEDDNPDYILLKKEELRAFLTEVVENATVTAIMKCLTDFENKKEKESKEPEWVSGSTLAKILGISRQTLHNWKRNPSLNVYLEPHTKGTGNRLKYDLKKIQDLVRRNSLVRHFTK